MATVGSALTSPETGWQRIEDTDSHFAYSGTFVLQSGTHFWDANQKNVPCVTFYFRGTKIRLISYSSNDRASDAKITIDGATATYSMVTGSAIAQCLVYEKTGLADRVHTVIITSGTNGDYAQMIFDAIDIDSAGFMSNQPVDTPFLVQDGTDIKTYGLPSTASPIVYMNAKQADGTNPGSGTLATFTDKVGAHNGTLTNFGFNATSGWIGGGVEGNPYALLFDGVDDRLDISIDTNASYAVSFRVLFKSLPSSTPGVVLSTNKTACYLQPTGTIDVLWPDGSASRSTQTLSSYTWYHIVVDMFSKKIYIDATDRTSVLVIGWSPEAMTSLRFGWSYYNSAAMQISWLRIYNQTIDSAQIIYDKLGGNTGTYRISGWQTVGAAPPTQAMFNSSGMADIPVISDAAWRLLTSTAPEILINTSGTTPTASVLIDNSKATVTPKQSITLLGTLKSIVASATESGAGKVRFALSGDGGVTWKVIAFKLTPGTINIIPAMTSNNTPAPVVISASDFLNSSSLPYMAFDQSSGTYWESSSAPPVGGSWLKIDLGSAQGVSGISLTPLLINSGIYGLANWELYGSNDDAGWSLLTSGSHDNSATKVKYTFDDPTPYRYFRLNVISSYHSTFSGITEIEMFGYDRTNITFESTDFIPKMTANNAPSPFVVSVDSETSGYNSAPFHVFDDSSIVEGVGTAWVTGESFPAGGHWLKVDLGAGGEQVFHSFSMAAVRMSGSTYSVKSWILYGSNDDSTWTQISSGTHENSALRKTYTVTSPGLYRYYRINFTDSWYSTYIGIYEVEFFATSVGAWSNLDVDDPDAFKNNGLKVSDFAWLNSEKLAQIISTDLRIAIYLEQQTGTDKAAVNFIRINSDVPAYSPAINSITINYDAIDEKYYGMLFMDVSQQYYSTSFGEILQYLDFGTLVAGTTSLEVKVTLTNGYNFPVNNIRLFSDEIPPGVTVELSKTTSPFISKSNLSYSQIMQPDETIDFYVRLTSDLSTKAGGNFNIRVAADPVT